MEIRTATLEDAKALLEIYAPYVEQTAITFEYDVPTEEEFKKRISDTLKKYPYIVAEEDGKVEGYAYAGCFKARAAYQYCVETSIYVRMGNHNKGYGKALYAELEKRLKEQGIKNLCACITWIDEENRYLTHQSPDFHKHLGYEQCAHFHKCGYKFNQWFDMIWMEKMIANHQ